MPEESKPQYASIEYPFGMGPPIVHCPACGQSMLEAEDGVITDMNPCDHLAFVFVGEISDFAYQSDAYAKRMAEVDLTELGFDNFQSTLKQAGYGSELLALEITHGGMACGPVWFTEVYGFDYSTLKEAA